MNDCSLPAHIPPCKMRSSTEGGILLGTQPDLPAQPQDSVTTSDAMLLQLRGVEK